MVFIPPLIKLYCQSIHYILCCLLLGGIYSLSFLSSYLSLTNNLRHHCRIEWLRIFSSLLQLITNCQRIEIILYILNHISINFLCEWKWEFWNSMLRYIDKKLALHLISMLLLFNEICWMNSVSHYYPHVLIV